ncbi:MULTISPECIES: hypothetical protein [Microcystis]|uniref:Uncharacterized protein n=2 Tax=Microcystis TaxID=1125 RepID=A0A841UIU8_MICAE|nr:MULTISPECIES: hypothetical protein [Microcystis]AKV67038.1 hypothetical protein VL20_1908 [Microcystis panniformis FACHB-1757]MBC1190055.1 hypothetical protein [Microcystis aeruginosa BLCC-F108]MCA2591648.1 hypothetical protein [Microcystis sp. M31BS1]
MTSNQLSVTSYQLSVTSYQSAVIKEVGKWGNGEAVSSPYHPKTPSPQNPITLSPYLLLPPADRLLDKLKKM